MSITIESSPPLVAILGNRVPFKLSSDNRVSVVGTIYELQLHFYAVGAADDSLTIAWGDKSVTFTCKASPDESGTQLPTAPANVADWVAVIAGLMQLNYDIDKDFIVSANATDLYLASREKGSDYIIDFSVDWTGTDPDEYTDGGVDEEVQAFFKLGLQTWIDESGTWEKLAEDVLPVDSDEEALFDIRRHFADQLESVFKFPEASDQLMILRENICREYKVRTFERFGDEITPQIITEDSPYFILNSGISHLQEAIYNRLESSFWAKLQYNDYFLTWQPKSKYIDRYQTEKLYFLVQETITDLEIIIEINYNDGTSQSTITKDTVSSPTVKGVYELALSLNVLQLTGYDQNNIDNYRVWMEDGDSNRISEIRTYVMDYRDYEKVRYFLFLNSLGGFDTLRITGDVTDGIEHERTDISKVLGEGFTEQDHQAATGSVSEVKTYKANTGWKTEEDISWIRDFLLSKQAYQIIAGKLVPIVITSTKATQRVDHEDLFSISFEYRRAFKNEFYSKQIVHADFNDDFDDDFANE